MGDGVEFALAAIDAQIAALDARYRLVGKGTGDEFFAVFRVAYDEILASVEDVRARWATSADDPKALRVFERSLERKLTELRLHDALVTEFAEDVGRQDLPVGFMMLIDKVCSDLLDASSDHLVHVSNEYDYSTSRVGGGLIVNLPAVDPANAMWAPILVHEIAHSVFGKVKDEYNSALKGLADELGDLRSRNPAENAEDDAAREDLLSDWGEELFCDAVATIVTGPSFLFALSSRLVGATWKLEQRHPPPSVRLQLVLAILERHGWGDVLRTSVPGVMTWAELVASEEPETEDVIVGFLCAGARLLFPVIDQLAAARVPQPFGPNPSADRAREAGEYFEKDLLPVEISRSPHIEWEFLLAAWLLELTRQDGKPTSLPSIPFDKQLNGLLIKTMELSRIVELWGQIDVAG